MVLVILGSLQFEAEKVETRTMPTPDMKGKEMIYWIRVSTEDLRLVSDLKGFLDGSGRRIELRVPSAFIWVKVELENYEILPRESLDAPGSRFPRSLGSGKVVEERSRSVSTQQDENQRGQEARKVRVEIILRRAVTETPKTQSPYG